MDVEWVEEKDRSREEFMRWLEACEVAGKSWYCYHSYYNMNAPITPSSLRDRIVGIVELGKPSGDRVSDRCLRLAKSRGFIVFDKGSRKWRWA